MNYIHVIFVSSNRLFGWFTQMTLNSSVDSTRIVQTVEDMERKWSSCFAVGKSQVWMDIKEEYGIRPKGNALLGDEGFWLLLTW